MSTVVFCGPTIRAEAARQILPARYLPPAACGDVYRATLLTPRPRIILIIDGMFRTVPAVRHKEILWAMAQGIHVFGAASMGALRAAELAPFGMVGVGEVYRMFRAGDLQDDDEVAVDHGPAELGYPALNESMVDIRATLAAAARDGIVPEALRDRLIALAKESFYARRSYPALLRQARAAGLAVDALAAWLPAGRVLQKQADARQALLAVRAAVAAGPAPFAARFEFEATEAWFVGIEHAGRAGTSPGRVAGLGGASE